MIRISRGSRYDGYFERMADRVCEVTTDEMRETILRLKFAPPRGKDHGVEYTARQSAAVGAAMPNWSIGGARIRHWAWWSGCLDC